jgi:hypothetical protein
LRVLRAGGRDFVTGPISDLDLLFPDAVPTQLGVYAPHHSDAPPVNNRAHPPGSKGM